MSGDPNCPWQLSTEWLKQWHLFQEAFYKWIPDKPTLSAASRKTQPDRLKIFADAMHVARGDIASLEFSNWLAWGEQSHKGHLSHPKRVLRNVVVALRADTVPENCGQDEQFDENWRLTERNRHWLADRGEVLLKDFTNRVRQTLPPLPEPHDGAQGKRTDSDPKTHAGEHSLPASDFEVVSFAELQRRGTSGDIILNGIWTVFKQLLPMPGSLPGNDFGSDEKWDALILEFPSCLFLLLDKSRICGYWMVLPVTNELYRDGLDGQNINKRLSLADTEEMSIPGQYDLYFVDLFVLPQYNEATPNIKLLRSFVEFLVDLSRNGIFVRRIFANVSSSPAEKTCAKVGFKFVRSHREHQSVKIAGDNHPVPSMIYELKLLSDERPKLWDHSQELADAYERERMR